MAGAKLSPRQKMINMMYLVLMALLALNVSKEILKSFYFFEQSFITAAKNIDEKNSATMAAFEKKMEENKAKTEPYYKRAQKAHEITAEFIAYVDGIQKHLEENGYNRVDGPNSEVEAADQMELHAHYFTSQEKAKGKEFMAKINSTRDELLELLKPDLADTNIKIKDEKLYNEVKAACQLNATEPEHKKGDVNRRDWIAENLEHNPAAGLFAFFARVKNDAKTLESDVLTKLAQQIDATDYKFDKLEAKVLANSSAVMSGGQFEADILLVASNSKGAPVIMIDGMSEALPVENGMGKYNVAAVGVGSKSFSGNIIVNGPEGEQKFPFTYEYQVFKPAATIAATEMNLLYVGLDNPMSISVPGFTDIRVGTSKGITLQNKGNGVYNAKVDGSAREVTISVSVMVDGASKSVGSEKFRVRRLPTPFATLGTIANDGLPKPKNKVALQSTVNASMGEGFAYDLQYAITEYRFIFAPSRRPAVMLKGSGRSLTPQMQSMIKGADKGDRIIIEGIKAKERKYGFTPNLAPVVITIQ